MQGLNTAAFDPSLMGAAFNRIPLRERTLPRILLDVTERFADRPFATLPNGALSYGQIASYAALAAGALNAAGAGPTIAILLGNRLEFLGAVWGQAWRGGVSAPLNPALVGVQLATILNQLDADVLITDSAKLVEVEAIKDELKSVRTIILVDTPPPDSGAPTVLHWGNIMAAATPAPPADCKFSAPFLVMYTSGTTGASKGVVVSHHHYYCYTTICADNHRWSGDDHILTPMPLCHASAHFAQFGAALMAGSRATVLERFSASTFWRDVAQTGATHASIIGSAGAILLRQPRRAEETQHRLKTIACSPPPGDPSAFEERFGAKLLWQAYGMTEGYFIPRVLEQPEKPRTAVGRPSPLYEVVIIDQDDCQLPWDGTAVGEIAVRPKLPYTMMTEYYRAPNATASAWRNGWFHTGDTGSIDADGFVHLRGRTKDSIRRRGENISAVELEAEAMTHPAVLLAAAFGVPSDLGEEDIKLDVVLNGDAALSGEDLVAYLRKRVASYMMPRYIQFRAAFPMTPSQRIEKFRLQQEGAAAANYDAGDGSLQRHEGAPE